MKLKIACLALAIALCLFKSSAFAQSGIEVCPSLSWPLTEVYNSHSRVNGDLRGYRALVRLPVDNRGPFYGEHLYRHFWNEPVIDSLYSFDHMNAIAKKIAYDIDAFGSYQDVGDRSPKLSITPSVEVFRSAVKGCAWFTCFAKVRLNIKAALNDTIIINKKYESVYHSVTGFSSQWEGEVLFGDPGNFIEITLGIALRKTLDLFYKDLFRTLRHKHNGKFNSILFNVGTTDIVESSYSNLDNALHILQKDPKIQIELDGYTDIAGDVAKDRSLAEERVKKIKSYLVHHGIHSHRVKCKAFGAVHPIATRGTEASRRLNRRVEFVIIRS